jgi:signal peptidase I
MGLNVQQSTSSLVCFTAITLQLLMSGCTTYMGQTSFSNVPVNPPTVLTDPLVKMETLPYDGQLYAASLSPTGSMRPTLHDYDLVLYSKGVEFSSIEVGDIILFQNPEDHNDDISLVCHRVIYRTKSNLITKGDNNPTMDPFRVREDTFYGKLVGVIRGPELPAFVTTVAATL